jgi:hypothetical protein
LEVIGVGTKIGITTEPNRRLYQHAGTAGRWGRGLGRMWFSIRHAEATANERALVDSEGKRTEVLSAGFDDVTALVERMSMTTIDAFFARWERAAASYKPNPRFDPPEDLCLEAVMFARAAYAAEAAQVSP